MNIAIFADLHGRIFLSFKLCARWQQETGEKIDLILQAGDMGIFPEKSRLDRATLKYSQIDPTELGFMHYFRQPQPEVQAVLDQLSCNLVFVRGNHEDHGWLDDLEREATGPLFPVDAYKRLFCLKTGELYQFQTAGRAETLNILGIGRIGPTATAEDPTEAKYIQPYEVEQLARVKSVSPVEVLLTHDKAAIERSTEPHHALPDYALQFPRMIHSDHLGMKEIREALHLYQPVYHFFGHIGGELHDFVDSNGLTHTYKLADLTWNRHDDQRDLQADSMGILRWKSSTDHSFEVIRAPWLKEYNAYSWQYLD
jgi:hypothetical protein